MAQTSIRPEDRLFHLILALMSSAQGLTKEQILSSVRGYREDTEAGVQRTSLERRFERDKDVVRELGIPLEAWIPSTEDGDNKNTLYRIPRSDYEIPDGFELTPQDIRLLNTAATVWREGSLSHEARLTHTKLASYGVSVDEPLIGFLPMITARDPALDNIRRALAERRQIRFDYLTPGETRPKTREVSPLATVLHEGRWHLLSVEAGQERTFLLRRIVSAVSLVQAPRIEAEPGQIESMTRELDELFWSQEATIEVQPGSQAAMELGNKRGSVVDGHQITVRFTDSLELAQELAGHGPEVRVISPTSLEAQHRALLERLLSEHG